jgi:hypothetical protein
VEKILGLLSGEDAAIQGWRSLRELTPGLSLYFPILEEIEPSR